MKTDFLNDENENHNVIKNLDIETSDTINNNLPISIKILKKKSERLDFISNRLKVLQNYINKINKQENEFSRLKSAIKTLDINLIQKKQKNLMLYENLMSENGYDEVPTIYSDIADLGSKFWKDISEKTGISVLNCYSLWINKTNSNFPFLIEEDETIYNAGQIKPCDWIDLSLYMSRPPFELFRRYKFISQRFMNERSSWTYLEDVKLKEAVDLFGEGRWTDVSGYVMTKNQRQCLHRYKNKIQSDVKKGRWSKDEDNRLLHAVSIQGSKNWNKIAEMVKSRNDSQCRERYVNVLDPSIKKDSWSKKEDDLLLNLVQKLGEKNWTEISSKIDGRTDAQCRRRYFCKLKELKKIKQEKKH